MHPLGIATKSPCGVSSGLSGVKMEVATIMWSGACFFIMPHVVQGAGLAAGKSVLV